jgi:hypothetical protein
MNYETELRTKNRGYMKLIVWQRAIDLFAEDPEEYATAPTLHHSITPAHRSYA